MTLDAMLSGAWFWRALAAATLTAIPCALIGCFLYLRRMSMIADALAHITLLGLVLAILVTQDLSGPSLMLGALLTSALANLSIHALTTSKLARPDAAVGIVFTALFALGLAILSLFLRHAHFDARCVLFGDILAISDASLLMLAILAPLTLLTTALTWRYLAATTFDAAFARSIGLPVAATQAGLLLAASATTTAAFETVGAILVVAMMILPAASAHLLARSLKHMVALAIAYGLTSAVIGLLLSVWMNLSSSGMIVTVGAVLYALTRALARDHHQPRGQGAADGDGRADMRHREEHRAIEG